VFLEKHWRSVISRSVCDYYLEAQRANPNDIAPVIATPHHYLISVQRGGVSFVAVCMEEIPPLFVIEFLHRVVDTFQVSHSKRRTSRSVLSFQDYFSDCTESIIKENYVVIYEVRSD
jgi:AP-3 complex subunit mu